MNKDRIIGNWKQFKGDVQQKWGALTNDQIEQINGDRTKLAGKIQEAYGVALEEAEEQINQWESECKRRHAA